MKYSTIIFDMDGTLLDTIADIKDSLNYILEKNGFEFVTLGKPKKGESRPTVEEFTKELDKSALMYVLNLPDYFVTVIGDDIFDVSDECLKSSVYSYWIKK